MLTISSLKGVIFRHTENKSEKLANTDQFSDYRVIQSSKEVRIHHECEVGIEKFLPRDLRLSSPGTRDDFFYPILT